MPALENDEAASPASCSTWEPTWAEIIVISGMADMMFSTRPTTRLVSSRAVPTGMRTLSMIMSMSWAGMNSVPRKGTMASEMTRAAMAPPRTQRRWCRALSSHFLYQALALANWRSSGALTMALRLFFERKRSDVDSGTTVRATNSDERSEKAMDRPRPGSSCR